MPSYDEPAGNRSDVEVSVVMPCLNEADTLAVCIRKARRALDEGSIVGEVVVADNGSTDGSVQIATAEGARVVHVEARGYGHALMKGFSQASGRFLIMGDADDSYDFLEIPRFVARLRQGEELVQGCRLPAGGGSVAPGAMPLLHLRLGNPLFSRLAQLWFQAPVNDVYCGLRGLTRDLYERLDQRCTGMEFATEMIIKASLLGARIGEVPITLHPDGRKSHKPHLRTFRDGWRTLRFFLLCSPRWLFVMPGAALVALGLVGYAVALPGTHALGVTFEGHTLLVASLWVICGYQSILFGLFTKTFAVNHGLLPEDARVSGFLNSVRLEHGIVAGVLAIGVGIGLLLAAVGQWWAVSFGNLDYSQTMRWVIPGVTLTTLGFLTILSSFFLSVLGMHRA